MTAIATTGLPDLGANQEGASQAELSEWAKRRNSVVAWLPHATREAVEVFALRHYDRAESAAFLIAEQHRRDDLTAERMASIEISQALDWARQSTVPSFQELQRRRSVIT